MIKDFDPIMDTAPADHVPMMVVAPTRRQYKQAHVDGDGQRNLFVQCADETTRRAAAE